MSPLLLLAPQAPNLDLRQPPAVAEATRIELTPRLDGRIGEEEWDALGTSGETRTFLQWEPGALHVAASAAAGKDLLVSLDPGADGWLVGKDNLEARIGVREGKPFVKLRLLDATNVAGPAYREIAGLEAASRVAVGEDGTIEATIGDPGLRLLPSKPGRLAARVDVVDAAAPTPAPNEPRILAALALADSRAAALPTGLSIRTDFNDIAAVPGETATVRTTILGDARFKRVAMRSEGLAREATSATEMPFPAANKRGVRLEYRTRVQPDASLGFRVARVTLTGEDGVPAVVQASYRIAPLVDVELNETLLKPSPQDRSVRVGYVAYGNSSRRLSGRASISVEGGYRIVNGDETQKLALFEPRRGLPRSFGLFVPANTRGTVPIRFAMEIDGRKFEIVKYLTID